MNRTRRIYIAKTAVILGVVPVLVWAYVGGPDVGKAGVPGESTCAEAGCHAGTVNSGSGKVSVAFPGGMTYVPGVSQRLVVTIEDPTQRMWGFQLTARQADNTRTPAGSFVSADRFTSVICGQSSTDPAPTFLEFGRSQNCLAPKLLAYIEHNDTAREPARIQTGSQTFQFDWTPPAANVGDVRIFVAGNAANGDANNTGDRIYTASYTLTPAAAAPTPVISASGVVNGASFAPGIAPNTWFTVQGSNLASTTNTWDNFIVNGQLPTSLSGVSVSVGGKPAYVYFVSPTQINAVAPDVGTGSMSVTVTNSGSTSAAAAVNSNTFGPAFFPWPGNQPVATRQDFSFAVKSGTFSVATTPAKPGDVIILWGTGFGPTSPAAPVGAQVPSNATYSTASPVSVTVGGANATVFGAALAPGFAALYQVAIQIPASAPDGDLPVIATIGGAPSPSGVLITVRR